MRRLMMVVVVTGLVSLNACNQGTDGTLAPTTCVSCATTSVVDAVESDPLSITSASTVRVEIGADGNFAGAVFPDGTIMTDAVEASSAVGQLVQAGVTLEFRAEHKGVSAQGLPALRIGKYNVRLSAETGRVGGCIQRTVPHLGFSLIDVSGSHNREIINLHLCGWREGRQYCIAFYNSANKLCLKRCFNARPPSGEASGMLVQTLVAAGVSYALATTIAQFVGTYWIALAI